MNCQFRPADYAMNGHRCHGADLRQEGKGLEIQGICYGIFLAGGFSVAGFAPVWSVNALQEEFMSTQTPSVKSSSAPAVRITDPWTLMRQEMNDLFENAWGGAAAFSAGTFSPALDVVEKDNSFELQMDVPGLDAKDLDIQVQGNSVTVSGHRKSEKEEKGKTFHRIERRAGSFSRTITLPCSVSEKEVAAEYINGVLNVILPKCEKARPSKITVKG
jgi:HSP20 family protein